jgi:hypothetical protein
MYEHTFYSNYKTCRINTKLKTHTWTALFVYLLYQRVKKEVKYGIEYFMSSCLSNQSWDIYYLHSWRIGCKVFQQNVVEYVLILHLNIFSNV